MIEYDPLELLRPYLHHHDRCQKWSDGWWNDEHDCNCGLEAALIQIDQFVLHSLGAWDES